MQEKTFLHNLITKICGKKFIMMITDTAEIMAKQSELQNQPGYAQIYSKISQSIRNHVISGGALAIALSLSLQRYFPSHLSTFGINKILIDLFLISVSLGVATNYSLNRNTLELSKIKKSLILDYDKIFLNHMAEIQIKYDIQEQDQIRGILTQDEYKQWLEKRHLHIF